MDLDYGKQYRLLFERHWWWRAREVVILDELHRLKPDGSWGNILDVGCGDGLFFPRLAELGVVEGVEPEASLLSEKGTRGRTIHRVPFDESFDPGKRYNLILMLDVLEHLRDPTAALQCAERLLKPGGTFLITVPAFMLLWTSHDVLNQHVTRFTRSSFASTAAGSGLSLEKSEYFFHWLFPAKLAARVGELVRGATPKTPRIPAAPINRLLSWICRVERRLLRPLHLPFGGSLLVIGSKSDEQVGGG